MIGKGRGDSVYRKSVGRDDPGAPFLGGRGFRFQEIRRVRRPRRAVSWRQGIPFPGNPQGATTPARRFLAAGEFHLQEICRARRPRRVVSWRQGIPFPGNPQGAAALARCSLAVSVLWRRRPSLARGAHPSFSRKYEASISAVARAKARGNIRRAWPTVRLSSGPEKPICQRIAIASSRDRRIKPLVM